MRQTEVGSRGSFHRTLLFFLHLVQEVPCSLQVPTTSLMLLLITIINTQTRSPGSLAVAATVLTADHTAAAPQQGGWSTLLKGTLAVVNEEVCQTGQRLCYSHKLKKKKTKT